MSELQELSTPRIAGPLPAPSLGVGAAIIPVGLLVAGLALGIWILSIKNHVPTQLPQHFSQLDYGLVTPVLPDDGGAVAAALSFLRLPDAQRAQIERDVLDGRQRLGWIIFIDSMDPDGDVVAVEAAGLVQHVSLTKAWTAVAVPISGTPIGITAVRDGAGGGVTVALGTRAGPVTLRILLPGERIEVAAP
jgi:hypothetical protein